MIKKSFDILGKDIIDIFKGCIKQCYVPIKWRTSKVVFIPKVGKTDYSNPKNFRPISLMSFLLKGLERMLLWFLEENTLSTGILHKNLFAYRAGRSTETALHCITQKIEKGLLLKGGHVITVFLDIDAAFSKASIKSMVEALSETNCNSVVSTWVEFMLRHRIVQSSWGNSTAGLTVTKGTPQGGILSPVLWNLVMNNLLVEFDRYGTCEIFCYADDLAVVVCGVDLGTVTDLAQLALNRLVTWSEKNELTFSTSKTVAMHLTRTRKKPSQDLKLSNKPILWVENFKYLGVIFDKRLSWNAHVESVKKRAMALLFTLRNCVGQQWGLKPKVINTIFTSMVRPIMSYGIVSWFKASTKQCNIRKLNSVQALANRMTMAAQRSVPTDGLNIILNMLPIDLFLEEAALMSVQRIHTAGDWRRKRGDVVKTTAKVLEDLVDCSFKELRMPLSSGRRATSPPRRTETLFEIKIGRRGDLNGMKVTNEDPVVVNCYTDGSKDENGRSGAAFISKCKDSSARIKGFFPLGPTTSVYQAEATAIHQAAMELVKNKTKGKVINFYVDNQGVIQAVSKVDTKDILIKETKQILNSLATDNKVTINWIPGHEGYRGNEIADRLAKRATRVPWIGCLPSLPVSTDYGRNICREKLSQRQVKAWSKLKKRVPYKGILP